MPGYSSSTMVGSQRTISHTNTGGSSFVAVYLPPVRARVDSILLTNKTGGALPVSIKVVPRSSSNFAADGFYVCSEARVAGGETLSPVNSGIIIEVTEQLVLQSPVASSIDAVITSTEGVI